MKTQLKVSLALSAVLTLFMLNNVFADRLPTMLTAVPQPKQVMGNTKTLVTIGGSHGYYIMNSSDKTHTYTITFQLYPKSAGHGMFVKSLQETIPAHQFRQGSFTSSFTDPFFFKPGNYPISVETSVKTLDGSEAPLAIVNQDGRITIVP